MKLNELKKLMSEVEIKFELSNEIHQVFQ